MERTTFEMIKKVFILGLNRKSIFVDKKFWILVSLKVFAAISSPRVDFFDGNLESI